MRKIRGFTLIELMIVVVIIAILALIAYPSYINQVRKSRRAQAKADLVELTQMLERQYTTDRTFDNFVLGTLNQSPFTGTPRYGIALVKDATTYTLTATPDGDQANDPCGTLTIDQLNVKTASGPLGTEGCW